MPNYGTLPATGTGSGILATVLNPGDSMVLFNAESPTATQQSIAFAMAPGPQGAREIVFTIDAASGTVDILGSNVDVPAEYQKLHTTTSVAHDSYADDGHFAYYSCQLSGGTGPVTVIAQR